MALDKAQKSLYRFWCLQQSAKYGVSVDHVRRLLWQAIKTHGTSVKMYGVVKEQLKREKHAHSLARFIETLNNSQSEGL